jgi:hypothetical protein
MTVEPLTNTLQAPDEEEEEEDDDDGNASMPENLPSSTQHQRTLRVL